MNRLVGFSGTRTSDPAVTEWMNRRSGEQGLSRQAAQMACSAGSV